MDRQLIEASIVRLLAARSPASSICPSEAARDLNPNHWRPLMEEVRQVAAGMATRGELRITQGEKLVDPRALLSRAVGGPIRLRRP